VADDILFMSRWTWRRFDEIHAESRGGVPG
jgi:hypothetical protein